MFTVLTTNETGESGIFFGPDLEIIKALILRAGHFIKIIEKDGTLYQT
jgi:hypothetical protein